MNWNERATEVAKYDHVYLSPHLDDAVLSCGGLIHQQVQTGQRVLVITLFAGVPDYTHLSPFASSLHAIWGQPADPISTRRAEDRAALEFLGCDHLHLDYLDCIYRVDEVGHFLYGSEEAIFGQIHPAEHSLMADLADKCRPLCSPAEGMILFVPLAVGSHVDHQIVHQAALLLGQSGCNLLFYEDYPYVEEADALSWPCQGRVQQRDARWLADLKPINVETKIEAVSRYVSQMGILFGSREEMARRVRAYAASLTDGGGYAERLWCLEQLWQGCGQDSGVMV
ncbi:MAG: PIG-L deacetylase family protein [Anaerolineae bacterium]